MFCDKNILQALTKFCSTDNTRPALKNVRFEGDNAIATNGHVLGIATFKDEDLGFEPPIKSNGEPFSVSMGSICKAVKNTPKKSIFRHPQGVFVAENVAASYSDIRNCAEYHDKVDQNYPNYQQVIPVKTPNDTVVSLGREPLGILNETMKTCGYSSITLRIPQMNNEGYVNGGIHFSMHGDNNDPGITGIVMPYNPKEDEKNTEHKLILQEDVKEMLKLLCEISPEHERVISLKEKYKTLLDSEN